MSKSVKLNNDMYFDSNGVVHRQKREMDGTKDTILLSKYLSFSNSGGTGSEGATRKWLKLFSIKPRGRYNTFYHHFAVIERENVGFMFEGKILIHLDVNYVMSTSRSRYFTGSYNFNDIGTKVVMLVENNTAQETEIGVYVYFPNTYNWRSISTYTISSNALGVLEYSNETFATEPSYVYKTEI